jgi:hypothetical protein
MKLILASLGMLMLLSTAALLFCAIASLISIFFGFSVGWGIAIAIVCFGFSSSAWKGLANFGIGHAGVTNNAEGAFALLHISALITLCLFYFSGLTNQISAWWALLMPLLIIPSLASQWLFEILLNSINPNGKRK